MKAWWARLDRGWREAACIMAFGFPTAYLTYVALGVTALLLGTPIEVVGYGAGWTAMGLLAGALGAGVGHKVALRLERNRDSAEGKERSNP